MRVTELGHFSPTASGQVTPPSWPHRLHYPDKRHTSHCGCTPGALHRNVSHVSLGEKPMSQTPWPKPNHVPWYEYLYSTNATSFERQDLHTTNFLWNSFIPSFIPHHWKSYCPLQWSTAWDVLLQLFPQILLPRCQDVEQSFSFQRSKAARILALQAPWPRENTWFDYLKKYQRWRIHSS